MTESTRSAFSWGDHAPLLVEAGVDWITCTYEPGSAAERARVVTAHQMLTVMHKGNSVRPFSLGGYYGQQCGGIAFGERGGSAIAQLTGTTARAGWRGLLTLGGRPSRLDVQGTWRLDPRASCPAREGYEREANGGTRGRRVSSRTLIQGNDGGVTLYLGAPSSETRLRVYDKGVEAALAPPGQLYRWELQARRAYARALAHRLTDDSDPIRVIGSVLMGEGARRNTPVPAVSDTASSLLERDRPSEVEDTLHWLQTAVRPAVARVLGFRERAEILRALGLSETRPPTAGVDASGGESTRAE